MTDVREAIDRVGSRFDPPEDGFGDLIRRRRRARVRRRLTAGGLAAVISAVGLLLAIRGLPASPSRQASNFRVLATWAPTAAATPMAAPTSGTICPTPSGDDPPPVVLSSDSGPAGSSIEVSGRFWNEELWAQLWWNAGELGEHIAPPPWPPTGPDLPFAPAGSGPAVELASAAGPAQTGECSFQTTITVPQVEPGTYQVQWVFGGPAFGTQQQDEGGFYLFSSVLTFQVTG